MSWRKWAQSLHGEAQVLCFALRHPRVRWYARLVAAGTAAYVFSPIQLIPSFIPVIGFLDDFLVVFLCLKLLKRIIPPDVLAECRNLAEAAAVQRKEQNRSLGASVGFLAVASVWLLLVITASALLTTYIRR